MAENKTTEFAICHENKQYQAKLTVDCDGFKILCRGFS